jgi:hypothetical protein
MKQYLRGIGDDDGPVVARIVYSELVKQETMDFDAIPYALDSALTALRAQGVPRSRWAPFVHIGA